MEVGVSTAVGGGSVDWLHCWVIFILVLHILVCQSSYIINVCSLQLRPTSIEKEIFPAMAEEGQLFSMELQGEQGWNLGPYV